MEMPQVVLKGKIKLPYECQRRWRPTARLLRRGPFIVWPAYRQFHVGLPSYCDLVARWCGLVSFPLFSWYSLPHPEFVFIWLGSHYKFLWAIYFSRIIITCMIIDNHNYDTALIEVAYTRSRDNDVN